MRSTLAKRFWEKVVVRGLDDCWEWTAYKNKNGYGTLQIDGESKLATHVLFYLRKGDWPPKGRTCNHHCDNPSCLNPIHIYLGTQKSNVRDRDFRGRGNQAKGEKNGRAKLTEEQVRRIKSLLCTGITRVALCRKFGVSRKSIYDIENGKNWAHVK